MSELPHHVIPLALEQPLADARRRLEAHYGDRLAGVILYGSYARGEARSESDVDLLVALRGPYDALSEIRRLTEIELDLLDEYDLMFSMQPYGEKEINEGSVPFLRHVREEGISL